MLMVQSIHQQTCLNMCSTYTLQSKLSCQGIHWQYWLENFTSKTYQSSSSSQNRKHISQELSAGHALCCAQTYCDFVYVYEVADECAFCLSDESAWLTRKIQVKRLEFLSVRWTLIYRDRSEGRWVFQDTVVSRTACYVETEWDEED